MSEQSLPSPKPCLLCGASFEKKANESESRFEERKYCSLACARAARKKPVVEEKTCLLCGGVYRRGAGTSLSPWQKRRYCSAACAQAASRKTVAEEKACVFCGGVFRRGGGKRSRWEKRRYCSLACARRAGGARQPLPAPKRCLLCGASFDWRTGETRTRFEERKYCSLACGSIAGRAVLKDLRESGPRPRRAPQRSSAGGWPASSPRFEDYAPAVAEKGSPGKVGRPASFLPTRSSAA